MKQMASRADFERTTRRYIAGDRTIHNYRCESLKSYKNEKYPVDAIVMNQCTIYCPASFPCKLNTFRKRVKKVVTNK
jgi:hypothetical protein